MINIDIESILNGDVYSIELKNFNTIYTLNTSHIPNLPEISITNYPFESLFYDIIEYMNISREWLASCLLRGDKIVYKSGPTYKSFIIESTK